MIRVLALVDRLPSDPDWKGGVIWDNLMTLAQSEYEVLVVGPELASRVELKHPNLKVASPIKSWRADQFLALARLMFNYQPDVVHVFAPRPPTYSLMPQLWPLLTSFCMAQVRVQKFFTGFDSADHFPSLLTWINRTPHFATSLSLAAEAGPCRDLEILLPSPISEWTRPLDGLAWLADQLCLAPSAVAGILGGWGNSSSELRRQGWLELKTCANRVRFLPDLGLAQALKWLNPSGHVATQWMNKDDMRLKVLEALPEIEFAALNDLSRLYSSHLNALGSRVR